ncbi:MAG: PhzF family phenazine biosynthesis protein [Candidatus Pseudomonas colombiensis]|nr:MAG: PhzF family phenazine biosynthesis protein [Pseudomonas sp.]
MQLEFHQIDAFSDQPFGGNPAMVYRLEAWLSDELMQKIAAEHNLSETTFVVREAEGWRIRWFTPTTEVALCGHATLASAYVLFEVYGESAQRIEFNSQSGPLSVSREDGLLWLDFPRRTPRAVDGIEAVTKALGVAVVELLAANELLVVLESEQAVLDCRPDMAALAALPWPGVIVTAQGQQHDFVSRYFAPAIGLNEDPVTGSTHCSLIPYWAQRLDKQSLTAYQRSARGGALFCRLQGERVRIGGHATRVASGTFLLG